MIVNQTLTYRKSLIPLDLDSVQYIFVHHPAWKKASVEDIHLDVLSDPNKASWSGFPYNEYIRKDGTVYIGRGDYIGAQCGGYNSVSYGIACEGNYDVEETMPEAQLKALVERCQYHKRRLPNKIKILPHGAMSDTGCPGKFFPILEMYQRIQNEDTELELAERYISRLGERPDYEYLVYRMKEIYENIFDIIDGDDKRTDTEKKIARELLRRRG